MTQFEFLSIAASIILALGLGKLVSAFSHVLDATRRDWLHVTFVFFLSIVFLQNWWSIWELNAVGEWTQIKFFLLVGGPLAYYLASYSLVSDSPSEVASWSQHFEAKHRWFFTAIFLGLVFAALRRIILLDDDIAWYSALLWAVPIVGIITPRREAHIAVAAIMVLAVLATIFLN